MIYKEIKKEKIEQLVTRAKENEEKVCINDEEIKNYVLYRLFLTEYLNLIAIKEYDEKIKDSELNFVEVKEINITFKKMFSYEEVKYFHIKNDLYIENLKEEEISKMEDRIFNGNYNFDDDAKALIENSYKRVLNSSGEPNSDNRIKEMDYYDGLMVESGTLVIEMSFDKFSKNGLEGQEWLVNYKEKLTFLKNISKEMEESIQKKLSIPVVILVW